MNLFLFFGSLLFFAIAIAAAMRAMCNRLPSLSAYGSTRAESIVAAADRSGIRISTSHAVLLVPFFPLVRLVLAFIHKRRCRGADRELPDALSLIGGAIKAGLSLSQAIEVASRELAGVMGEELRLVASKIRLGQTIEEALALLNDRLPTEDISLVVSSVGILRKSGGNLIETFSVLSATVSERIAVEEKIAIFTAQGISQGVMLIAMPWVLCLILHLIAPEYVAPLITTRLGLALIAAGLLLETVGALWIHRIVSIRV